MRPIIGAVLVAAAALAPGALAAQSLDTTVTVRSDARLDLTSVSGTVRIQSWNRSQIRVVAQSDGARVDFDANYVYLSLLKNLQT